MIITTTKCAPKSFIVKTCDFEQTYFCGEDSEGLAASLIKQLSLECSIPYDYDTTLKTSSEPDIPNYVWVDNSVFCLDIDLVDMDEASAKSFYNSVVKFVDTKGFVKPIAILQGHSFSPKFLFTPVTVFDPEAPESLANCPVENLSAEEAASLVGLQLAATFDNIKCVEVQKQFFRPRSFVDLTNGGEHKWSSYNTDHKGRRIASLIPEVYDNQRIDPTQLSSLISNLFGPTAVVGDYLDHSFCPQHDPEQKFSLNNKPVLLADFGVRCFQCDNEGRASFFSYNALSKSYESLKLIPNSQSWWSILWHACRNLVWWNQIRYYFPLVLGLRGASVVCSTERFAERLQQKACIALSKSIKDRFWWKEGAISWHPGVLNFGVASNAYLFRKIEGFGIKETELNSDLPACFNVYYKSTNKDGEPTGWKILKSDSSPALDEVRYWKKSCFMDGLSRGEVVYGNNLSSPLRGCMGIYGVREINFCPAYSEEVEPLKISVGEKFYKQMLPREVSDNSARSVWEDIEKEIPEYDCRLLKAILVGRAYFEATQNVGLIACIAPQGTGKTGQRRTAARVFGAYDFATEEMTAGDFFKSISSERSSMHYEFAKARPFRFLDEAQSLGVVDASVLNSMVGHNPKITLNRKYGTIVKAPIGGPIIIAGAGHTYLYDQASFTSRATMIRLNSSLGDLRDAKNSKYVAKLDRLFGGDKLGSRGAKIQGSEDRLLDRLYTWTKLTAKSIANQEGVTWQSLGALFNADESFEDNDDIEYLFKSFLSRCIKVRAFNSKKNHGIVDMTLAGARSGSLRMANFLEIAGLDNGSGEVWQKISRKINSWIIPPEGFKYIIGVKKPALANGTHSFGLALVKAFTKESPSNAIANIRKPQKESNGLTGLRALKAALNYDEIEALTGTDEDEDQDEGDNNVTF